MATHCFIPLLGKRIRVTELDSCGVIPEDATQISTDGFVSITLSAEVEEGNEIIVRKASGALCVNEKQADSFKRFTVEMDFCGVNPSLLALTTNAEEYADGDEVIGFTVPEGEILKWFALELWTGLSGAVCAPGAEEASGYVLLPFVVAGVLGDIEVTGEDAITFQMTGAATKGGNGWGVGPYDVYMSGTPTPTAGPLPEAIDAFDHLLMIETNMAPPPDACDPAPVPTGA
ncbi:major tail protein [Microbacterium phage Nicole72]|uniref:Major tail protein n=1 Tax=Microbacterium phage Nicole72 TaxID=3062838 RepID=A0ACD4UHK8_9CAUD|nr:major tail protein [Microbacterium phage Nicole72]